MSLSSCGGGGGFSDAGNAIGKGTACALLNCVNSGTLTLNEVRPTYVVTQNGTDVHVTASIGKGGSLISVVQLSDSDTLSASVANQSVALVDSSNTGLSYFADLVDGDVQPAVTVTFARSGTNYPSTVTLPKQFALLSPTAPLNVTRAMPSFTVQLGIANDSQLTLNMVGHCTRVDATSFAVSDSMGYASAGAVTGGTAYQVNVGTLDSELNFDSQSAASPAVNTSQVQSCDLQFSWIQTQNGKVSSLLSGDGSIVGQTSVTHEVLYNAQR